MAPGPAFFYASGRLVHVNEVEELMSSTRSGVVSRQIFAGEGRGKHTAGRGVGLAWA